MIMKRVFGLVVVAMLMASGVLAQGPSGLDEELRGEVKAAIDRGLGYLRWSQAEDGSWGDNLPLTAMALKAFTDSHRGYKEEDGPFIRRPLAYLRQSQSEIGPFDPRDTSRLLDVAQIRIALEPFEVQEEAPGVEESYLMLGLVSQDQFKEAPDVFDVGAFLLAETLDGQLDGRVRELSVLALARLQDTSDDWGFVRNFESSGVSADATAMGLFGLLLSGVSEDDVRVQRALTWMGGPLHPGPGGTGKIGKLLPLLLRACERAPPPGPEFAGGWSGGTTLLERRSVASLDGPQGIRWAMDGERARVGPGSRFDACDACPRTDLQQPDPVNCLSMSLVPNRAPEPACSTASSPALLVRRILELVLMLSLALPALGAQIDLDAEAGFDGYYRVGQWLPVRVDVSNTGPDLNGELVVTWGDVRFGQIVALPAPSRKSLEFYVRALDGQNKLELDFLSAGRRVASRTLAVQPLSDEDRLILRLSGSDGWVAERKSSSSLF